MAVVIATEAMIADSLPSNHEKNKGVEPKNDAAIAANLKSYTFKSIVGFQTELILLS